MRCTSPVLGLGLRAPLARRSSRLDCRAERTKGQTELDHQIRLAPTGLDRAGDGVHRRLHDARQPGPRHGQQNSDDDGGEHQRVFHERLPELFLYAQTRHAHPRGRIGRSPLQMLSQRACRAEPPKGRTELDHQEPGRAQVPLRAGRGS